MEQAVRRISKVRSLWIRCVCSLHYAVWRKAFWWICAFTAMISSVVAKNAGTPHGAELSRTILHISLSAWITISLAGVLIWVWREQQDEYIRFFICGRKVAAKAPRWFPIRYQLTADESEAICQDSSYRSLFKVMQPGDEIWFYCSGAGMWGALAGREGFMVCRGDRVIAKRDTRIS